MTTPQPSGEFTQAFERELGVDDLIRISEFSRRAGIKPELLRAWETRYGVPRPRRSAGGLRLYSAADLAEVLRMKAELARGLSPAEAAPAVRRGRSDPGRSPGPATLDGPAATDEQIELLRGELAATLGRFDGQGAHSILDLAFDAHGVSTALREVILPYLRELGEGWERGEIDIAQEHFACSLLRARLLSRARSWGQGSGPLAVLGCAAGEHHDLGLAAFGMALRNHGWRIVFLGADTPAEAFEFAAARLRPRALVVTATRLEPLRAMTPALVGITELTDLWLGGPAADSADDLPGRMLEGDPVQAASALAGLLS